MNWNSNDGHARTGKPRRGLTTRELWLIAAVVWLLTTAVFAAALAGFMRGASPDALEAVKEAWSYAERLTRWLLVGGAFILCLGWEVYDWTIKYSRRNDGN
jgi:hypothetical protein